MGSAVQKVFGLVVCVPTWRRFTIPTQISIAWMAVGTFHSCKLMMTTVIARTGVMSLELPPAQMAIFSVLIEASNLPWFRPPESMTAFVIVVMAVTNGPKLEVPASIIA